MSWEGSFKDALGVKLLAHNFLDSLLPLRHAGGWGPATKLMAFSSENSSIWRFLGLQMPPENKVKFFVCACWKAQHMRIFLGGEVQTSPLEKKWAWEVILFRCCWWPVSGLSIVYLALFQVPICTHFIFTTSLWNWCYCAYFIDGVTKAQRG